MAHDYLGIVGVCKASCNVFPIVDGSENLLQKSTRYTDPDLLGGNSRDIDVQVYEYDSLIESYFLNHRRVLFHLLGTKIHRQVIGETISESMNDVLQYSLIE